MTGDRRHISRQFQRVVLLRTRLKDLAHKEPPGKVHSMPAERRLGGSQKLAVLHQLAVQHAPQPPNRLQPMAVVSTAIIQFSNVASNEVPATPADNRKAAIRNRLFAEFADSTPRAGFSAVIEGMNGGPAPQGPASFPDAVGSGRLAIAGNAGLAIQSCNGRLVSGDFSAAPIHRREWRRL